MLQSFSYKFTADSYINPNKNNRNQPVKFSDFHWSYPQGTVVQVLDPISYGYDANLSEYSHKGT